MASNKELREENEKLRSIVREGDRRAEKLRVENRAYAFREQARIEREHKRKQDELKAAERQKRNERLKELGQGIFRMGDAVESKLTVDECGTEVTLTFALDKDEASIVGDNLRYGRPRIGAHLNGTAGATITASYVDEFPIFRAEGGIDKALAQLRAHGF